MHLKCKDCTRFWRKKRIQKCPNGRVLQFLQGHQKPAFSKKVQRGDQGIFLKTRPKIRPRLKGLKALWRKWHYSWIIMLLTCKDWRWFWRKRRLQKCPNGQVMAIFARSPKTRIFWKSAREEEEKFLKNHPKSSPCLKGKKGLWGKLNYTLIKMHLKCQDLKRFWHKQWLQKCPNGQVMVIIARSPKTRIFWKSEKGGPRQIFQKSPKK